MSMSAREGKRVVLSVFWEMYSVEKKKKKVKQGENPIQSPYELLTPLRVGHFKFTGSRLLEDTLALLETRSYFKTRANEDLHQNMKTESEACTVVQ